MGRAIETKGGAEYFFVSKLSWPVEGFSSLVPPSAPVSTLAPSQPLSQRIGFSLQVEDSPPGNLASLRMPLPSMSYAYLLCSVGELPHPRIPLHLQNTLNLDLPRL